MKLQVSLIPALAYALVMMFSDMAGWKAEVAQPEAKQQMVVCTKAHQSASQPHNFVWVTGNGQLILSNGTNTNLEWRIPYQSVTNM